MGGISHTLNGVTAVTAALEDSVIEILDLHIVSDQPAEGNEGEVLLKLRLPAEMPAATQGNDEDEGIVFRLQIRSGDVNVLEDSHCETTRSDEIADNGRKPSEEQGDVLDDTISCRNDECDETFETERGMKIHFTKIHLGGASALEESEDGRPAFADPVQLRHAYEKYDTFEKMTDALDADVSPATVRRHMIKYGIYDPASEDNNETPNDTRESSRRSAKHQLGDSQTDDRTTSIGPDRESDNDPDSDGDERGPHQNDPSVTLHEILPRRERSDSALPDDAELPDDVTVPDVVKAVIDSQTVCQVSKHIDTDHETAREALERMDMLDLVEGRLDATTSRENRERKVAERIK